jgi:hypothetical protein
MACYTVYVVLQISLHVQPVYYYYIKQNFRKEQQDTSLLASSRDLQSEDRTKSSTDVEIWGFQQDI